MYIIYVSENCPKCFKTIKLLKGINKKFIIRNLKYWDKSSLKYLYNECIIKELEIKMDGWWKKYLIKLGLDENTKEVTLKDMFDIPIIYLENKYIGNYEDLILSLENLI